MAQFSVNTSRLDPYKNFQFRIKWDGRYVAGVSSVRGLKQATEAVTRREGGVPGSDRKSPRRAQFEAVTLEHGVTHDPKFAAWASEARKLGKDVGVVTSIPDYRKDIIIEIFNDGGQKALSYRVFRCWVSEFQAQPAPPAHTNAVTIQTLKLENEGRKRDPDVTAPSEPSL